MIQAGDIVEFVGQPGVQYEVTSVVAGPPPAANLLHRASGKTIPFVPVGLLMHVPFVGQQPSASVPPAQAPRPTVREGVYIACARCNRKYAVSSPTSSRLLKCGRCGTDQCQDPHCCN